MNTKTKGIIGAVVVAATVFAISKTGNYLNYQEEVVAESGLFAAATTSPQKAALTQMQLVPLVQERQAAVEAQLQAIKLKLDNVQYANVDELDVLENNQDRLTALNTDYADFQDYLSKLSPTEFATYRTDISKELQRLENRLNRLKKQLEDK
jgi:uncharacterized protein YicC (UPF0701 family)